MLLSSAYCLTLTSEDLKNDSFTTLIKKISEEVDSQGRNFLDWDSSVTFYQQLAIDYPYIVRELKTLGTTELGENIYGLHMSYQYTSEVDDLGISDRSEFLTDIAKPSIVIIGGHLGNSMVAHSFIMALISKLVHGFHNDNTKLINLLKMRHIWFVPYLNIDTYKYIQSYTGSISNVQNMLKSRKVQDTCNDLEIGVNLLNNYGDNWGIDNFGSSNVQCLSRYRGTAAFSAAETTVIQNFFNSVNDPKVILSLESSGNYIKYPFNYQNDASNPLLSSKYYSWFYTSLIRDVSEYNTGIRMGNYVSLFRLTNNGDNDDYFRNTKNIMSFTWNVGHSDYGTLALSDTTAEKISNIISTNLDLGIYAIEKAGEQITATVRHFNVCIPTTEECDGYEPSYGVWRYFVRIQVYNTGVMDLLTLSEVKFILSNSLMSFDESSYTSATSTSRRSLSSAVSIVKTSFYSQEQDVINYEAIIEHDTSDDPLKSANSLGDLSVTLTYYGSTITIKDLAFSSYDAYKDTLDEYYYSRMKRGTFVIFVLF